MKYDIFAGMGGSFGGAIYQTTEEFNTLDEAYNAAYEIACENFESYSGIHGIKGWEDCLEEAEGEIFEEDFDDYDSYIQALEGYADEVYNEERESWIDYWAEESTGKYDNE